MPCWLERKSGSFVTRQHSQNFKVPLCQVFAIGIRFMPAAAASTAAASVLLIG
jgi:hypothetical protein